MDFMMKHLLFLSFLLSSVAVANETKLPEDTLSVDRIITQRAKFNFPNDSNIHPDNSDFTISSSVLLSSESGERWATVTVENKSSGQRFLNEEHVMALFANGDRLEPKPFKVKLEGKEVRSLNIYFGQNKFPILDVYTRMDEEG